MISSSGLDTLIDHQQQQQQQQRPSPSKKVAPLIEERHEWLQEQEKRYRQQSIRDEDIPHSYRSYLMDDHSNTTAPQGSRSIDTKHSSEGVANLASRYNNNSNNKNTHNEEKMVEIIQVPLNDDDDDNNNNPSSTLNPHQSEWGTAQSMDLSMDSLDRPHRENLGDARRQKQFPILSRHNSDATVPIDNTAAGRLEEDEDKLQPFAEIQIADSEFLGFARFGITHEAQVLELVSQLRLEHPHASHIPYAYLIPEPNHEGFDANHEGFDEDGEPENSTGPFLLEEVRDSRHEREGVWLFPEEAGAVGTDPNLGTCVVIVRYFGSQLLGVTCGRLSQCYQRIAQLTLHRLFRGNHVPLQLDFTKNSEAPIDNLYGLAGGDTEIHLGIVKGEPETLMEMVLDELDFEGFKGAAGEVLPRLQNLQADFYQYNAITCAPEVSNEGSIIPIYRYPGNYFGDEWKTFPWSDFSLEVKEKVEATLPHFYNGQKMNHCVTNFYRDGDDYIAHHNDKDLDLDRTAAIVSVSIGAERVLELRRRAEPRDLTRVILPHGSMLLLGPVTNKYFTHSILPVELDVESRPSDEEEDDDESEDRLDENARISLTLRHVTTFMDTKTRRLFGQGVEIQTLQELRRAQRWDSLYFALGLGALGQHVRSLASNENAVSSWLQAALPLTLTNRAYSGSDDRRSLSKSLVQESVVILGSAALAWASYTRLRKMYLQRKEERAARQFFTSQSTSGTKY